MDSSKFHSTKIQDNARGIDHPTLPSDGKTSEVVRPLETVALLILDGSKTAGEKLRKEGGLAYGARDLALLTLAPAVDTE